MYETPISLQEVRAALAASKSGKAPGPSEVSVDILKHLNDAALCEVVNLFERCRKNRSVPDSINKALLRMLPKTEKGMADITQTRPISLMEHLLKVHREA